MLVRDAATAEGAHQGESALGVLSMAEVCLSDAASQPVCQHYALVKTLTKMS